MDTVLDFVEALQAFLDAVLELVVALLVALGYIVLDGEACLNPASLQ